MAEYKHGAYGEINGTGSRSAENSQSAIIYVGTAPVHLVEGGAANVNVPIVARNMADARKYLGYSEDFAAYTLCEAMKVHFDNMGVGPIVFINVLDPTTHKASSGGTATKTPANGRVTIPAAESIVLDSIVVKSGATTKVKGTDYTVAYSYQRQTITIAEVTAGSLGTTALTITYDIIDPSAVEASDVIGSTDGMGLNTGVYAVKDVYQKTGFVPSFLAAPGFSSIPDVHNAMVLNSRKVNGHFDVYMFVDLPIVNGDTAVTIATAATFKEANGYDKENESVYFPLAQGVDGRKYHLSTLAAANFQANLVDQDGIPYKSASNTECSIIENLYLGEDYLGRNYDDTIINEYLNKNGISSAAFVGGRWAIWGAHSADYTPDNANTVNVAETNRMMLFFISNEFQVRRVPDVDQHITMNGLNSIVAAEQARLDALVGVGALIYGKVTLDASADAFSDLALGDYRFIFEVTATPLAKSLTAVVSWTDEGFVTYYENFRNEEV